MILRAVIPILIIILSIPGQAARENGDDYYPRFFQYLAYITADNSECSGFFISPTEVLTAAHCVTPTKGRVLVHSLITPNSQAEIMLRIKKSYDDIAIIELSKPHPLLVNESFSNFSFSSLFGEGKTKSKIGNLLFAGSNGSIPLVNSCNSPEIIPFKGIKCNTNTNHGQSGSALIGYDVLTKEIRVYGVLSAIGGIRQNGTLYINHTVAIPVTFLD